MKANANLPANAKVVAGANVNTVAALVLAVALAEAS